MRHLLKVKEIDLANEEEAAQIGWRGFSIHSQDTSLSKLFCDSLTSAHAFNFLALARYQCHQPKQPPNIKITFSSKKIKISAREDEWEWSFKHDVRMGAT